MRNIIFLTLPLVLFATSSFITPKEYASQLYKNPRGIGCQFCHGDNGEGKLIANYIHKGKKRNYRGPVINKMKFDTFYEALNQRKNGMPRYYLTHKEIEALYFHLHRNDKNDKQN